MAKDLFKKTLYRNNSINILKGTIREYDMKEAGFSIIKNEKLLPLDKIVYLQSLTKQERTIQIGKYMLKDKVLNKTLTESFAKYRELFIKSNNIPDNYILSIKKDAIFIINKTIDVDTFGEVKFVMKNRYTSYYYMNKMEFYFNSMSKKMDIKGIKDDKLKLHKKYMLRFLRDMFTYIELGNKDGAIRYLKKFANKYRNYELDLGYYREFNAESMLRIKDVNIGNFRLGVENFYAGLTKQDIDINYNYATLIVNLMRMIYK